MDRGEKQTCACYSLKLCIIVGYATPGAAQGEGGAYDDRVADKPGSLECLLLCIGYFGRHYGLTDSLHGVPEQLPVLGFLYGIHVGADKTHMVAVKDSALGKLHGYGQPGLAA